MTVLTVEEALLTAVSRTLLLFKILKEKGRLCIYFCHFIGFDFPLLCKDENELTPW
jgi:hypothetical protein